MDHYKTLWLSRNATKDEIKEAFRRLALKFHPDKHLQSSKEVRDGATIRFKQVSEAYEVLIDDQKRADYSKRCGSFYGGSGFSSTGYDCRRNDYRQRSRIVDGMCLIWISCLGTSQLVRFFSILGWPGGAVAIERSGDALWRVHNSGKLLILFQVGPGISWQACLWSGSSSSRALELVGHAEKCC